jgi:hypothetical protein
VLQILASGLVVLAGLYVALIASPSGGIRLFGWLLVLIGLSGLATAAWLRTRRR